MELSVEPAAAADGSVTFFVHTNLPNNSEITLSLYSGEEFIDGQTSVLWDGQAEMQPRKPLEGHYTLCIDMPPPRENNSMIFEEIGMNGEALAGKYVVQSENGPGNAIKAEFEFDF